MGLCEIEGRRPLGFAALFRLWRLVFAGTPRKRPFGVPFPGGISGLALAFAHRHHMIPGIDVQDFSGNAGREIGR